MLLLLFCVIFVQVTEAPVPFTHFLTKLCAIIGGAFTISGIIVSEVRISNVRIAAAAHDEIVCPRNVIHTFPFLFTFTADAAGFWNL